MLPDVGAGPVVVSTVAECELARHGLVMVLQGFPGRVRVVSFTENPDMVDVVLMDPDSAADVTVVEAMSGVRSLSPSARLVAWCPGPHQVARVLELGFDAYLSKKLSPTALLDALEQLATTQPTSTQIRGLQPASTPGPAGGRKVPVFLAPREAIDHDSTVSGCGGRLSGRELDMLRLIAAGRMNRDICQELYLTNNTVKYYIRSAYRKIGVTTRVEAVRWWMLHPHMAATPTPAMTQDMAKL